MSAGESEVHFQMPELARGLPWRLFVNTAAAPPHDVFPDLNGPALARNASVELSQRSTVVLVAPDEV